MGITVNAGEPDFIVVSYDVHKSARHNHNRVRSLLQGELLARGANMVLESEYEVLWSQGLYDELIRLTEKYDNIDIDIKTPKYPNEQLAERLENYERGYAQHWSEIDEKLEFIEAAYVENVKHKKTGEPYTAEQLLQHCRYVSDIAQKTLQGLHKRRKYELDRLMHDPNKMQYFEHLEHRMRKNITVLNGYIASLKLKAKHQTTLPVEIKSTTP